MKRTGRTILFRKAISLYVAIPYDLPIVGYNNNVVNTLRVWDAEAINGLPSGFLRQG